MASQKAQVLPVGHAPTRCPHQEPARRVSSAGKATHHLTAPAPATPKATKTSTIYWCTLPETQEDGSQRQPAQHAITSCVQCPCHTAGGLLHVLSTEDRHACLAKRRGLASTAAAAASRS